LYVLLNSPSYFLIFLFSYFLILISYFPPPTACASDRKCFTTAVTPPASCNGDAGCLCQNKVYVQSVLDCITSACTTQADIDKSLAYSNEICKAFVRPKIHLSITHLTHTLSLTQSVTTAPAGVTTASPGFPKSSGSASASAAATTSPSTSKGAAPAPIAANQHLVLFAAAALAVGVTL
jgi:hypothetical protein